MRIDSEIGNFNVNSKAHVPLGGDTKRSKATFSIKINAYEYIFMIYSLKI